MFSRSIKLNSAYVGNTDPADTETVSDTKLDELKQTPLDNAQVAAIFNKMLSEAAQQPGYSGIPITSSNPVTSTEVSNALGSSTLTQSELVKPYTELPQATSVSDANTAPDVVATPGTETGTSTEIDMTNPGIEQPTLEEPPTGEEILSPILTMFDDFDLTLNLRSVECPIYSFAAFGKTYVMDSQCELIDQYKSVIASIFLCIWGFLAFRIVMEA